MLPGPVLSDSLDSTCGPHIFARLITTGLYTTFGMTSFQVVDGLTKGFVRLVRERPGPEAFEAWISDAVQSPVGEGKRFVQQLVKDREAVCAGLTLEWNNGTVEGQVNRLKLIKRSMYGRAKFDLLRQRVLLAA